MGGKHKTEMGVNSRGTLIFKAQAGKKEVTEQIEMYNNICRRKT